MTALRQLRKVCRQSPRQECEDCTDVATHCRKCAVLDSYMAVARQREFARVYLDIRYGRHKAAMDRLERVLDEEAPYWRELA